jgi:predicted nicotinamide N-methyase
VSEANAIEQSLRRRFRVKTTAVTVGPHDLSILHPESAEELINEADFERDERLPYWAELWPSALVLAKQVAALEAGGRTLLELGCGAGLVSTAAGIAGFDVTATDYYDDALRFATVNAVQNGAARPKTLVLDWRHLPESLPRFDLVIASDVLYERPYGALIARTIDRSLNDDGRAIIADPGRVGRDAFLEAIGSVGLTLVRRTECPFEDGPVRQTITLFEIARG